MSDQRRKTARSEAMQCARISSDVSTSTQRRVEVLIIGCGNILCGDDAAGPVLIRRMWEIGLPPAVHCADGGTGGMDVAFQMRGVPHVVLVDACRTGSQPGTLFEVPGSEVERLPPLAGINLHAFRWDHAIAFARWLLKGDYPDKVTAFLIEGEKFGVGDPLSEAVNQSVDRLVERLFRLIGRESTCDSVALRHDASNALSS
ncbi:MAG: hydrogenase maturation protease [Planctomycetales bacterium]|nr:hydrogenase maturation protease [Planctomycetales bacterium]